MITYIKGNLLDAPEPIIVHGCNAQGVMGSGVALALRTKWPEIFKSYKSLCQENYDILGSIDIVQIESESKVIINAITQKNYGKVSDYRYVSYDAVDMVMKQVYRFFGDKQIAMPMIGAGLGNGDWNVIEAIINHRLKNTDVRVYQL